MGDNQRQTPDVVVKLHTGENVAEFCVKRQIAKKVTMYTKGIDPAPDSGSLAADCLEVDGVESVGVFPYEVLIGKAEMFEWEPLCEKVAGIVAEAMFDAEDAEEAEPATLESRVETIDEEFKNFFSKK